MAIANTQSTGGAPIPCFAAKERRVKEGVSITYEFLNSGLGPAIIDDLVVSLNGERITADDPVEELLRRCIGGKMPYLLKSSSVPSPRFCLKSHEEYLFAEVHFPGLTQKAKLLLASYSGPPI